MAVDIRKIKKLIELLEESAHLTEIEIKEDKESIRLSRTLPFNSASLHVQTPILQAAPAPTPTAAPTLTPTPAPSTEKTSSPTELSGHIVKSPMVGTVYLSSSPESKPFVEVGQSVEQGQVLCIVEAMKMFNQIEAEVTGKVTKRLIQNGQPVEYDQPLFIIE